MFRFYSLKIFFVVVLLAPAAYAQYDTYSEPSFATPSMPSVVGYAELYLEVPFQSQVSVSTEDAPIPYYVKQQSGHRALLVPIHRQTPARITIEVALPDATKTPEMPETFARYLYMKPHDRRRMRIERREIEETQRIRELITISGYRRSAPVSEQTVEEVIISEKVISGENVEMAPAADQSEEFPELFEDLPATPPRTVPSDDSANTQEG